MELSGYGHYKNHVVSVTLIKTHILLIFLLY